MGVDDHLRMQPTTSLEEKTKRYTYARHTHPSLVLRVPLLRCEKLMWPIGEQIQQHNLGGSDSRCSGRI